MVSRNGIRLAVLVCGGGLWAAPAFATFHLMQIEQIIGGVKGDTTQQAIQLRMRQGGQNLLDTQARIRVFDAAGANPVVITTFPPPNPVSGGCVRILIASPNFASVTMPPVDAAARDYVMTNLIPASYLAAGSLTFESVGGLVYWRVSWGGAGYTGLNTGQIDNTTGATGNFGPAFAGPLPSTGCSALNFNPVCPPATSNGNNADYTVTAGNATFFNDSGTSFQVAGCVPTLSQWGAMGLALLVLTCGTLAIRGRTPART